MIYQNEKELQNSLEQIDLNIWGDHDTIFFRREVQVSECIPDMIYIGISNLPFFNSWPRKWNNKYSYIIWLLKQWGELGPEATANLNYTSIERITPLLNDLIKYKIIIKQDSGLITLSPEFSSIDAEVIAIEVKMNNWRQALIQAKRYQNFSNKAIVAMDANGVPRQSEIIRQFEQLGIGLCAISKKEVEWLSFPKDTPAPSFEREYLISSAIVPVRQIFWSRRYSRNAPAHA